MLDYGECSKSVQLISKKSQVGTFEPAEIAPWTSKMCLELYNRARMVLTSGTKLGPSLLKEQHSARENKEADIRSSGQHAAELSALSIDTSIHDALNLTLGKRYRVQADFINQWYK
jgi:hypothetical protein